MKARTSTCLSLMTCWIVACHPLHTWSRGDRCEPDADRHHDVEVHRGYASFGRLGRDEVTHVVESDIENLKTCDRLTLDPETRVREVTFHWVVAADGRVSSFHLDGEAPSLSDLSCCIRALTKEWRFPRAAEGDEVEISYPFRFAGDDTGVAPPAPASDQADTLGIRIR